MNQKDLSNKKRQSYRPFKPVTSYTGEEVWFYTSLVVTIVLALIAISTLFFRLSTTNNQETDTNNAIISVQRQPLTYFDTNIDPFTITSNATTVTLPVNIKVYSIFSGDDEDFSCLDKSFLTISCNIYEVSDEQALFYISTPGSYVQKHQFIHEKDTREVVIGQSTTVLNSEVVPIFNDIDGSIIDTRVLQLFGCINDEICFSSGIIPTLSKEQNNADVTQFLSFLEQIII